MMDFNYKQDIRYGLGHQSGKRWRTLTRDLLIDLRKGVAFTKAKTIKKSSILIQKVSVCVNELQVVVVLVVVL